MKKILYIVLLLVALGGLIAITSPVFTQEKPQTKSIEAYFSPIPTGQVGGIRDRIIKAISDTQKTIDIAIFDFTSDVVAQSLKSAKEEKGVKVSVIMDRKQAGNKYSKYEFLNNNFNVISMTGKSGKSMHHKFCIFDNKMVMTGSYNISENAESFNYENVVFISDKSIVKKYQEVFEEMWNKR
ncbi:MAG: phospholipase D-like domain-containing protein [Planctomycetota bacterium]|nr:phospholipase D-like domain-containing protein [Planctomycetota bacterium]MDI6787779.1 phospholipase D-like domain-containing protein [Planctomycetota bacterium]